jgi:hypothetical protein
VFVLGGIFLAYQTSSQKFGGGDGRQDKPEKLARCRAEIAYQQVKQSRRQRPFFNEDLFNQ